MTEADAAAAVERLVWVQVPMLLADDQGTTAEVERLYRELRAAGWRVGRLRWED